MTTSLAQLQVFETKLVKAMADPTKQVWYDDFRRENYPYEDIAQRLAWVRAEIAAHPDTPRTGATRSKMIGIRPGCGL